MKPQLASKIASILYKHGITDDCLTKEQIQASWHRVVTHQVIQTLPEDNLLAMWHVVLVLSNNIGRIDCWLTKEGRLPKGLRARQQRLFQ